MEESDIEKPPAPELPKYLCEPLENQSPERLEAVAAYAGDLAKWKYQQRQEEHEYQRAEREVDPEELKKLDSRNISTDPEDYEDVPIGRAYITVKTTKKTSEETYCYYYWQWRDGNSWGNEYIAPVNPRR